MVNVKIRFDSSMKDKITPGTFDALRIQVEKKLKDKYPDLNVIVGWGTQGGLTVDGLKKNEKKDYIEEAVQEIWEDDSWLPEVNRTEDVEYFDK
ncbi:DinI-like family protein [Providencia sneebia]|uniref:UV protection and mutation protein n=1 Tax=Providencia sneebia DSM 19967 TaxID=1141660 RepID=K8WE64_9GAMM|nr:UV protection and mutation protein [Providencia sneebia DSM 19967]